jgi:hypothetical protein
MRCRVARAEDGWERGPSDIVRGDWVDRLLPAQLQPYARLACLDRPIGTWLLLFPGWWGIALASPRAPSPMLLARAADMRAFSVEAGVHLPAEGRRYGSRLSPGQRSVHAFMPCGSAPPVGDQKEGAGE